MAKQSIIHVYLPSGESMELYLANGSQVEYNLIGDTKAVVQTECAEMLDIPLGSYIIWNTEKFWLVKSADVVMRHSRNYEYTITFLPLSSKLKYILFTEQADDKQNNRVSFSATLRPIEFMNQILKTIQERLGIDDIEIGNVTADDVEKNVVFDSNSVYDSLNMIAEAFATEWHIRFTAGKYYIDFGIIEYDKDSPLQLDYGKDRGFLSGLSYNHEDQPTIKRLYVQGGTRNINFDTYIPQLIVSSGYELRRSNNLMLPYVIFAKIYVDGVTRESSRVIKYDGRYFGEFKYIRLDSLNGNVGELHYYYYPAENGFDETKAKTYNLDVESLDDERWAGGRGTYIENLATRDTEGIFSEVAYKNEDVYPQFESDVETCEIEEGAGNNDLGVFKIYHKIREIAKAKEDKTFIVLDCVKNGDRYEFVPNEIYQNYRNTISGYVSLGYHSFTEGERVEIISSIGILSTSIRGQSYLFYAARLIDNNTVWNHGRYGSKGDDKILDNGKVVAIVVSTASGSGPYTFNYDLFSTDPNVRVQKEKDNFPNYQDCIVPGAIPSVVFQSGMLAGKEFKLRTTQNGDLDEGSSVQRVCGFAFVRKSGDTITKTYNDNDELAITDETTHAVFVMLREEIDNIVMADNASGFTAKAEDMFAVFNVKMPYVYLANAEVDLLKAAVKYMYENENPGCNINGSIDELFLQNNYEKFMKIRIGEYVHNNNFDIDVRIVQIIQSLSNEFDVRLSFSEGRKHESLGSKINRFF